MKWVTNDVLLDPLVLKSNLYKRLREKYITWKYDIKSQYIQIKTRKKFYILPIPIPFGNRLYQNSFYKIIQLFCKHFNRLFLA